MPTKLRAGSRKRRKARNQGLANIGPSELDLCDHCNGKSNAYCPTHGITASNARQSEFYRKWNEKHGD